MMPRKAKRQPNRLKQIQTQQSDQNGTVRNFDYDKLGRLTNDLVTTLGTGVDATVQQIAYGYETRGLLQNVTSYNSSTPNSGTVINDVLLQYNTYQQLQNDYQSHSGAVNTGTTPLVSYAYANGSANTVRLNSITYPNGRVLTYDYGTSGSNDDLLSRVTGLSDSATSSINPLIGYTWLGLDTSVVVAYNQPAVQMTYIKLSGETNGPGGDQYNGLDLFNRVVDVRWINSSNADINRFKYGFSLASNRLWRQNVVASSGGFDEQYQYDGIYQVEGRKRGTLSGGVITGTPVEQEQMTFDPTGNWPAYGIRESGSVLLNQTRAFGVSNEITSISPAGSVGYDNNGNMTTMPKVDVWGTAQTLTYDAWNRMVTVKQAGTAVGTYAYDGLNRRTTKQSVESGTLTTRHFYYSNQWQVLEERTGTSTTANRQYVWGIRYRDDVILGDAGSQRMYALADYFQPTALADTTGTVQERYVYRAFGDVLYFNGSFTSISSSAYNCEYLYGCYYYDLETHLYNVRNRYYHSALGRWLTRDPLADAELSQGANLYWYVQDNPANNIDASGQGVATVAIETIISQGYSLCVAKKCRFDCFRCLGTVSAANAVIIGNAVRTGIIECLAETAIFDEVLPELAAWCILAVLAARGALFAYDVHEFNKFTEECLKLPN
jgi:RHS repeat-associated protein